MHMHSTLTYRWGNGLPCMCTHVSLRKHGCTCRTLHVYTHNSMQTHCCTHAMPHIYIHTSMSTHHTRHIHTNTATQTHPSACTTNTHTNACTNTPLHTSSRSYTCMTVHHSCTHPHGTQHHGPQHHTTHEAGSQAHPLPHTQETLAHTNRLQTCRHCMHTLSQTQPWQAHCTCVPAHTSTARSYLLSPWVTLSTQGSSQNLRWWWVQPGCPPISPVCALGAEPSSPAPLAPLGAIRWADRQVQAHPHLKHTHAHAKGVHGPTHRYKHTYKLYERLHHRGSHTLTCTHKCVYARRHIQSQREGRELARPEVHSGAELTRSQLSFPMWRWRMAGDIPGDGGRARQEAQRRL